MNLIIQEWCKRIFNLKFWFKCFISDLRNRKKLCWMKLEVNIHILNKIILLFRFWVKLARTLNKARKNIIDITKAWSLSLFSAHIFYVSFATSCKKEFALSLFSIVCCTILWIYTKSVLSLHNYLLLLNRHKIYFLHFWYAYEKANWKIKLNIFKLPFFWRHEQLYHMIIPLKF